ncbi:MAG: hypothetical protein ACI4AE_04115 [Candidatus Cryptobacteroides sp.]
MKTISKDKTYKWTFENIGGSTRVKITSGQDIVHLEELDPKMWTVLSCPVKGLEINDKSLSYIDSDKDGKIRVADVIATSKWITAAITNPDLLLEGKDVFDIESFNRDNATGLKLYKSAKQILANLGKDGQAISIADTSDIAAIFAKTRFNGDGIITAASSDEAADREAIDAAVATVGSVMDRSGVPGVNADLINAFYQALADWTQWSEGKVNAPFGDQTDKVIDAYRELDPKVRDYFLRSRLAAFSPESTASLDVQTARIESISAENLAGKTSEIASYPLMHISRDGVIDLSKPVNPAWAAQFGLLRTVAFAGKETITEEDWDALAASFAGYTAWKESKKGEVIEPLGEEKIAGLLEAGRKAALLELVEKDSALSEEAADIENVDKFLHIFRDFGRLLRNFVTFQDFYDKDKNTKAIFQSGTLIVDQRACRFCMKVDDMGKHNSMAAASGMYLLYCDCTTKDRADKLQIVAAVTVGDIGDFIVGKNAIYYDNDGREWDAVITKIIDNPISIAQAFWSPYRRMATAVENLINKNAADKDAAVMKDMNTKLTEAQNAQPGEKKEAVPFDIGKFAGIFAALGMALGMIGTALASIVKGFVSLTWWQVLLVFAGLVLVISGPAMVMAWLKLRRRNIAPLLNANGWAINASSKISILFGETLTDIARFPKLKMKDPYARKGMAPWKRWALGIATVAVILAALWLFNLLAWAKLPSPLSCFAEDEVATVESVDNTVITEEATEVNE